VSGRGFPRESHRTRTPSTELPAAGSATSDRPPLCIDHRRSDPNKQHPGNSTKTQGTAQALPMVAKQRDNIIRRNTVSSKAASSRRTRRESAVTARSADLRFSPEAQRSTNTVPPHHQRRAANCELQDGVFKKSTTQERRHRLILGS
jgi:hypothetical protein